MLTVQVPFPTNQAAPPHIMIPARPEAFTVRENGNRDEIVCRRLRRKTHSLDHLSV